MNVTLRYSGNLLALGLLGAGLTAGNTAEAGTFLGFVDNNPNVIVHPNGYTGSGGELVVSVCLDPTALPPSGDPEQAIRNAIAEYNRFQGNTGNVSNTTVGTDFETVLLHELGHCIGMDHSALGPSETCDATPDGFDSPSIYFANSFGSAGPTVSACGGATTVYSTNAGADGQRATRDDLRGSDINRNWFRRNVNNPFETPPAVVDRTTHSVDLVHLPSGHNYVEVSTAFSPCASGTVNNSALRGQAPTQNTMFPVNCNANTLRDLAPDDIVTLRIARAGIDGVQGTADDYTVRLNYVGQAQSCNIRIRFQNDAGFAFCSVSGTSLASNQLRITGATAVFQNTVNWFYNQTDTTATPTGPVLTPTPASGSTTAMPAGSQGQQVSRNISFAVSGGAAGGTTQLSCSGSGAVSVDSGSPQTIAVGGSASPVVAQMTLSNTSQSGQVACVVNREGVGTSNLSFNFTADAGSAVCSGNCLFRNGFE